MTDGPDFPTQPQARGFEAQHQASYDVPGPDEKLLTQTRRLKLSGAEDVTGYGNPVPFSMPATVGGRAVSHGESHSRRRPNRSE